MAHEELVELIVEKVLAKLESKQECNANCCTCDATTPRQFEQSAARFNDQSAFNAAATMNNFALQQQANWMTLMQKANDNGLASHHTNLKAVDRMYRT